MQKLTAIIPTFNEAMHIKPAIESVLFADEILILDSFSTDKTLEIAREFPVKIIQREYQYSASQKNWAIPQATHEWVFILDADERITPGLKEEITAILKNPPEDIAGFWVYRKNHFLGQPIKHSGWKNDKVIRLFKRDVCRYENKHVHAEIQTQYKLGFLSQKLEHFSFTSFNQYINKLNKYALWQAKDYDATTGKLTAYHFVLKPAWRFFKHYIIQQGFRDGTAGFIISSLQSYAVKMRYVQLWLFRKEKNN